MPARRAARTGETALRLRKPSGPHHHAAARANRATPKTLACQWFRNHLAVMDMRIFTFYMIHLPPRASDSTRSKGRQFLQADELLAR
ncbi:hypothetical protein D3250_07200 [Nesterenkonia natronophila]|uniref:Uncharacterized protein n=1 Tax=Nesterenkonia natronophila TaxID=2174932 RepID=A0A3A4F0Z5_9MICC|nr:hypothetical protein D3250_07200 [Nesterenkonia natronophila]